MGLIAILITVVIENRPRRAFLTNVRMKYHAEEMRFSRLVIVLCVAGVLAALASDAARFLVVDAPEPSDAIVVLAGETNARPARALELLRRGVAPHVFLNVQARDVMYDQRLIDIAQKYVNGLPEANRVSVCPVMGLSTFAEADDANRCLQSLGAHRVLIVTSEFHTRRASTIFRHRLPQYRFSVAAAHSPGSFGDAWWTNREWAKITFDEWSKILWWEAVDRWR